MPTDNGLRGKDDRTHRRSKTHLRMGIPDDAHDGSDRIGNWPGNRSTHPLTNEEEAILWGRCDGELADGEEEDDDS